MPITSILFVDFFLKLVFFAVNTISSMNDTGATILYLYIKQNVVVLYI